MTSDEIEEARLGFRLVTTSPALNYRATFQTDKAINYLILNQKANPKTDWVLSMEKYYPAQLSADSIKPAKSMTSSGRELIFCRAHPIQSVEQLKELVDRYRRHATRATD